MAPAPCAPNVALRFRLSGAIRRLLYAVRYWGKPVQVARHTYIARTAVVATPYGGSVAIGSHCEVHGGAMILTYGGAVRIGDHSTVNPYCVLYGHGGLTIGRGVRIAAHAVFIPANHNFDRLDAFIYEQGETCAGIAVEDDVWIGAGATILDGVRIARGCVIAAGAVVTRSTAEYGVYAGVPARLLRRRGERV